MNSTKQLLINCMFILIYISLFIIYEITLKLKVKKYIFNNYHLSLRRFTYKISKSFLSEMRVVTQKALKNHKVKRLNLSDNRLIKQII